MEYGTYRYDEPYARPVRRRINYFAWTVAILLLTGFAFAAWLGSFYIFSQPERPDGRTVIGFCKSCTRSSRRNVLN